MSTEVIVSIVGLVGAIVGAVLNGLLARKTSAAKIEKLKAEAEKARAEAAKTRGELENGLTVNMIGLPEMTFESAEDFARSLAAVLSRYILMEYLIRVGHPAKSRSRERNLVEVELFLSLNRKAIYAHLSTLATTTHLHGTNFEYRDLLRASIYNLDFISSLREALEEFVNCQAEGALRVDLGNRSAKIENALLHAFERTLMNPKLALLRSWDEEKFVQKYDL